MSILRVPVTPDDHIAGKDDALATLVEYGDYECPACGAAHPIVNQLRQHFGDELRFVFQRTVSQVSRSGFQKLNRDLA